MKLGDLYSRRRCRACLDADVRENQTTCQSAFCGSRKPKFREANRAVALPKVLQSSATA